MCGCVNLGDNVHATLGCVFLELTKTVFGIVAVLGGEFGKPLALKTEGGIGIIPRVLVNLCGAVVKMDLEGVHLIVSHHPGILFKVIQRYVLAAHVNHIATHGKIGPVAYGAPGQCRALVLLHNLQQGACAPISSCGGLCLQQYAVGNLDAVAFLAQFLVFYKAYDNGSGRCFGVWLHRLGLHSLAEHQPIVGGHFRGGVGEGGIGIQHFGGGAYGQCAFGSLPMAQLGDNKRFCVLCFQHA